MKLSLVCMRVEWRRINCQKKFSFNEIDENWVEVVDFGDENEDIDFNKFVSSIWEGVRWW